MRSQQKTHEQFLEELLVKNESYKKGEFKVLGEYLKAREKILLQDKYSLHEITPDGLLRGSTTSTASSINKKEYCENYLKDKNINLSLINVDNLKEVIFDTKYGACKAPFYRLSKFKIPNISSAVDKTSFMINEFTELHKNRYDYTESVFINARIKIKVRCKTHGMFDIDYSAHKVGQNCGKCANNSRVENTKTNGGWSLKDWWHKASKSKNFDSFKMYVIRCWNENEEFYKIGRTFSTVKYRFSSKDLMPYNYEVVQIRESEDAHKIYCLEKAFKNHNKDNKYNPQISFNGKQECFTKIVDINNGKEIK